MSSCDHAPAAGDGGTGGWRMYCFQGQVLQRRLYTQSTSTRSEGATGHRLQHPTRHFLRSFERLVMEFRPLHRLLLFFDPAVRIQWITNRGIISQKVAVAGSAALGVLGCVASCAPALFISISCVSCRRYNGALAKSGPCFCLQATHTRWGVRGSAWIISHSLSC